MDRAVNAVRRNLPLTILMALLAVLVLLPVGMMVYAAFLDAPPRPGAVRGEWTFDNFSGLFSGGNLPALRNSLIIGVFGTGIAVAGGSALAWLAARSNVPGKILVQVAGVAPMFMSSLVTALAWSILASPQRGYLNIVLDSIGISARLNVYSMTGIILVMGMSYMPYVYLLVVSALSLMNPELEEAAAMSGASRWTIFRTVTFPIVAPATIGASLLTFVLVIENFPVPQILGGQANISTLPSFIYALMNFAPARANEAAAVSLLLTLLTFALVGIQNYYVRKRNYTTVSGKGLRPAVVDLGRWRWVATGAVAAFVLIAIVLPFVALFLNAAAGQRFVATVADLVDPATIDLGRFGDLLGNRDVRLGLRNSIIVALGAAVAGGLLHFTMSYFVHRTSARGRSLIEYIAMIPLAVPSLVLGLGFLWTWFLLPVPLYGTLLILVLAYMVRFMPQGFRGVSSTIVQIHPDLEDSAYLSGASRARSVWDITFPLIRTGLVSTMLLLAILTMRELSAAIFLFTSRTRLISIVAYDYWENGSLANSAGISLIYSAILLALTVISRRWLGIKR